MNEWITNSVFLCVFQFNCPHFQLKFVYCGRAIRKSIDSIMPHTHTHTDTNLIDIFHSVFFFLLLIYSHSIYLLLLLLFMSLVCVYLQIAIVKFFFSLLFFIKHTSVSSILTDCVLSLSHFTLTPSIFLFPSFMCVCVYLDEK